MAPEYKSLIQVNDEGHDYDLRHFENPEEFTSLKFIKKEPDTSEGALAGALRTVHDGTTTEAVLEALLNRLSVLHSRLPDTYTAQAIDALIDARDRLKERNADREKRGAKGTNLA